MILVDTSVWVDYFNGVVTRETDLLDGYLGTEPLLTGDLILAEVLQGFRSDRDFRRAKSALDSLSFAPMVGRDIALASAQSVHKAGADRISHADEDYWSVLDPLLCDLGAWSR